MRIAAYQSVESVNFNIKRAELIGLLGSPEREMESDMWAVELYYPLGIYRFNSNDQLKEISVDAPKLEIDGKSVAFEHLAPFLESSDAAVFEASGFLVSPKFGFAFDQFFPSWVTAFPREELQDWHDIGRAADA